MRNRVLSIFQAVIPYVKELRSMAGSMEGCILMQQLDYWFAIKPDGFYKFLEPVKPKGKDAQGNLIPGHRLYRPGDSWCEELNCTPHEFRRMFDAVGVRWNSKREFMNADDPFVGRGYCSYVDRKENLTHYFRNHVFVDAFLDQFVADGAINLSISGKRSTDIGGLKPQSSQKPTSIEQRLPSEINTTTTNASSQKESHVVVSDLIFPTQTSHAERKSIQAVLESSGMDVSKWQEVLDELTGAMLNRTIANPVGFLRGIAERAISGTFAPERGIAITQKRMAEAVRSQEVAATEKRFNEKSLPIDAVLARLPAATSAFLSRKIGDGGLT